MKSIFRALALLSVCFASAKLQATSTTFRCTNLSTTVDMNIVMWGTTKFGLAPIAPATTIYRNTTNSSIQITAGTTEIRVSPVGLSGNFVSIPVGSLSTMQIKATSTPSLINVTIITNTGTYPSKPPLVINLA